MGQQAFKLVWVAILVATSDADFVLAASPKIEIQLQPRQEVTERGGAGIGFNGKTYKYVDESLHFIDSDGRELRRIQLNAREEKFPPDKQFSFERIRQIDFKIELSKDARYAGITRESWLYANVEGVEGALESSRTFQFFDSTGRLLWERANLSDVNLNAVRISSDGSRVALILGTPLTQEEQGQDSAVQMKHTWVSVIDKAGLEVFSFDPGPQKRAESISMSSNGRYLVVDRQCLDTKTGQGHSPDTMGFVTIDDGGICRLKPIGQGYDEFGQALLESKEFKFPK